MKKKKSKTRSAKTASSATSNPRGSKNGNRTTASSRTPRAEPTSGSERSSLDPRRSRTLRSEDEISENPSGRLSGVLEGIEDAPAADQGAVRTHRSAEPEDEEIPSFKNRNRL